MTSTKTMTIRWDTDSNPQNPGWVASIGDDRGWQPLYGGSWQESTRIAIDADNEDILDAAADLATWECWGDVAVVVEGRGFIGRTE